MIGNVLVKRKNCLVLKMLKETIKFVCDYHNINIFMSVRETVSLVSATKKSIFRDKINPGIFSI